MRGTLVVVLTWLAASPLAAAAGVPLTNATDVAALTGPAVDVPLDAPPVPATPDAASAPFAPVLALVPDLPLALPFELPVDPFATNGTNASAAAVASPGSVSTPARFGQLPPDVFDRAATAAPPARGARRELGGALAPAAPEVPGAISASAALGATAVAAMLARLYSRFRKDTVLRAEARARIHELLRAQPGATVVDLALATGQSRGATVHHCQMLERHGLVASRYDGLHRRYFLAAGPRPDATQPRAPTRAEARLLAVLQPNGPRSQAELARALHVSVQSVSYHLLRLERMGAVARVVDTDTRAPARWRIVLKDDDRTSHPPGRTPSPPPSIALADGLT